MEIDVSKHLDQSDPLAHQKKLLERAEQLEPPLQSLRQQITPARMSAPTHAEPPVRRVSAAAPSAEIGTDAPTVAAPRVIRRRRVLRSAPCPLRLRVAALRGARRLRRVARKRLRRFNKLNRRLLRRVFRHLILTLNFTKD